MYRFRFNGRVFHVTPDVPAHRLDDVHSTFGMTRSEHVIALFAKTAFRGSRTGFAITEQAIYWRSGANTIGSGVGPFCASYSQMTRYIIRWHESHRCGFIGSSQLQRGMSAEISFGGDIDRVVYEMLQEIQQAVLTGCELHPGVLWNGVAYSRGRGRLVEHVPLPCNRRVARRLARAKARMAQRSQ